MIHDDINASVRTRIRCALLAALCAIAVFMVAGCAGTTPEPAPPPAETERPGREATDYVPADAQFMRDMIVHHRQALEMSSLVPDRTDSEEFHLLARRIIETQEFEIGLMRDWLQERGEPLPDPAMAHEAHEANEGNGDPHAGMAGMASPAQMAALAESRDETFERMFLELMIRHHEGALVMLEDLIEHEGAGLQSELYVLLSHVDADQRAEIARMRQMLGALAVGR